MAWEDALEKLKVLDYEVNFCRTNGLQPFSRYAMYCGNSVTL